MIEEACFRMNGNEEEVRILEKRAHIQAVYEQVRLGYPSLPPLRDFQVASIPHKSQHGQFQADIIASAADNEDASHILSCLPTGYGKSLPMLLLSLFLPQGMTIDYTGQVQPTFTTGSITVIVVPLTSIADQLKMECSRLGLSAVVGGEVVAHWSCLKYQSSIQLGPEEMRSELLKRPHILICSAEFLSSEEVDPGHLLQLTSVVIDFWYIHTDGCTRCVIDSLLKCENRENG